MAASEAWLPPRGCKQRLWEVQLGEWLGGVPECEKLEAVIRDYRPWDGIGKREIPASKEAVKRRIGYASKARGLAAAIKQRLWTATIAYLLDTPAHPVAGGNAPTALNALAERVPMFDRIPAKSQWGDILLDQIFVVIFMYPRPKPERDLL